MTDIVDIFLGADNVEHMDRLFRSKSSASPVGRSVCGMRGYMHEFIYGPYQGGLADIWTGTDVDLYLRQMNDEFIKYMEVRYNRAADSTPAVPSARMEMAARADPFRRAHSQAVRAEMSIPRRPTRQCTSLGPQCACPPRDTRARPMVMPDPRRSASGMRALHRDTVGVGFIPHRGAPWGTCPRPQSDIGAGAMVDRAYARINRDQVGAVHLATRDDEGSDVGQLFFTDRFGSAPNRAAAPYDCGTSAREWMTDPTSESGQAQYHLIELDAQMSVLNDERTIPLGFGTAQEQLADDARIAQRYAYRAEMGVRESGVIPKTSYKHLARVQSANGRVTLEDDRILSDDIFSRDSKGFILSGRR